MLIPILMYFIALLSFCSSGKAFTPPLFGNFGKDAKGQPASSLTCHELRGREAQLQRALGTCCSWEPFYKCFSDIRPFIAVASSLPRRWCRWKSQICSRRSTTYVRDLAKGGDGLELDESSD
jgi:hypothetical protein